jgi:hypothetical protein
MSWFARFAVLAYVAIFVLHAKAVCQESRPANRDWDLGVWMAVATGEENTNSFTEAQILSAGSFVGRTLERNAGKSWWRGDLEYGFSISPIFFQLRPQHLHGIAFEPIIIRWSPAHAFRSATPYVELAGGAVRTNLDLPAGNTSAFNFTASGGAGLYLGTKGNRRWDVGARWAHISNANLGIQNPEFNGIQIRLAYHWYH